MANAKYAVHVSNLLLDAGQHDAAHVLGRHEGEGESLNDGARFQSSVAVSCGRASSVVVVSTSLRGSG